MEAGILRKKPVQAGLALLVTAGILLAGTAAWSNFSQSRINLFSTPMVPDVNLHDDFAGGPNKDVYVENSGNQPAYVRVRLTEYLQTDRRGSLVEGQPRDEARAKWWAPHNGAGGDPALCALTPPDAASPAWAGESFHDYYTWTLGGAEGGTPDGQIYYKPATAEQKSEYGDDGALLREPEVVSDPLTETSAHGDAHLDYADQVAALTEGGQTEAEALEALGLKKTRTARVVTMTDWLNGSNGVGQYELGDFWVLDEADGWCYWASPLDGGQATGLLLDRVDRTKKPFDSNTEYCVNVWLQAVDKSDLGRLETADSGGMTDNGKRLLWLCAGRMTTAEDGSFYQDNGDGTYTQVTNAAGETVQNAAPFVALAVDVATGESLGVNAPEPSRITVGTRVNLTDLGWNGERYALYDDYASAPRDGWYNLTADPDSAYECTGALVREDGLTYLTLAPVVNGVADLNAQPLYVSSVVRETGAAALALDEAAPAAVEEYRPANPGAGPYAQIFPGTDDEVGTPDDGLYPAGSFTEPFLRGITSGDLKAGGVLTADGVEWAVVEVDQYGNRLVMTKGAPGTSRFNAENGQTVYDGSILDQTMKTYYNDQMAALGPLVLDAYVPQDGISKPSFTKNAPAVFAMSLQEVEKFLPDPSDPIRAYSLSGENGWRTRSTRNSGVVAVIGKAGDVQSSNTSYGNHAYRPAAWVRFSDADTVATATPEELAAWKHTELTEDFLFGKSSDDLNAGGTFTADGWDWVVLTADKYGNRLVMTTTVVTEMGARSTGQAAPDYPDTDWPARATTFVNELTTLKPYARAALLPEEPRRETQANVGGWGIFPTTEGLSVCTSETDGYLSFPLSANELVKYIHNNPDLTEYQIARNANGEACNSALRTCVKEPKGLNALAIYHDGSRYFAFASTAVPPRMAMWVRFSDADKIATATAAEMEMWKTHKLTEPFLSGKTSEDLAVGSTITADGVEWVVVTIDQYGNRMLATVDINQGKSAPMASGDYVSYAGSLLETNYKAYYDSKMSTLRPYVLSADLPDSGLSTPRSSKVGAAAFALSAQECSAYFARNSGSIDYIHAAVADPTDGGRLKPNLVLSGGDEDVYYTRTPHSTDEGTRALMVNAGALDNTLFWNLMPPLTKDFRTPGTNETVWYFTTPTNATASRLMRPAVWVRFSDAEVIATASRAQMDAWKQNTAK